MYDSLWPLGTVLLGAVALPLCALFSAGTVRDGTSPPITWLFKRRSSQLGERGLKNVYMNSQGTSLIDFPHGFFAGCGNHPFHQLQPTIPYQKTMTHMATTNPPTASAVPSVPTRSNTPNPSRSAWRQRTGPWNTAPWRGREYGKGNRSPWGW